MLDTMAELERIRAEPVTTAELPRRATSCRRLPAPVRDRRGDRRCAGRLAVHDLPDDELARYRARIEAVTIDDVQAAATRTSGRRGGDRPRRRRRCVRRRARGGRARARSSIERDRGPRDEGRDEGVQEALGPVDEGSSGPTEGGESRPAGESPPEAPRVDRPRR
jgi:hypothetical protein